MRAARFWGDGRISLERRPIPRPGQDEVVVKVHSCALCGTDRGAYLRGSQVTPGHEVSGTIEAAGERLDGLAPGMRGVMYLVDFCGRCFACRSGATNMCSQKRHMYGFTAPGGYADYVVVRSRCFLPVDDAVPLDVATALLDLLGTTHHAFERAAHPSPATVGVLGCGPIGLGAIAVARARGIDEIYAVDVSDYRLRLAETLGARPVDGAAEDAVASVLARQPDGCDIVIEAAGVNTTQRQAIAITAPGGRAVLVAHNRQSTEIWTLDDLIVRERSLVGSEYFPIGEFGDVQSLITTNKVDPAPLLTHRFSLEEIDDAFECFFSGESGKVLVQP
jgi:threonine 3-dehydrogenase